MVSITLCLLCCWYFRCAVAQGYSTSVSNVKSLIKIFTILRICKKCIIYCRRIIEGWRDRGVRVMAWSVNRPTEKTHFSKFLKVTYLTDTLHLETDM